MVQSRNLVSVFFVLSALIIAFASSTAVSQAQVPYTWTPLILKNNVVCVNESPHVTLSWGNPNYATQLTLFRINPATGLRETIADGNGSLVSHVDVRENKAGTYQYQIRALGGVEFSRHSDPITVNVLACSTPTQNPPPTTAPSSNKVLKWGVYTGWSAESIREFESIIPKNFNILATFTHWGNENSFPSHLAPFAKDKGRTLLVFWEASDYRIAGPIQPNFSYDSILAGNWDWYIRSFAEQARAYGSPVILIPFSEMNGDWFPWGGTVNGNTPTKAVAAYRHVRTVFGSVPNVKFGWAPNAESFPRTAANAIDKYYPGDTYVDYVGVDGFNFDYANNPWETFDQIFGAPLTLISKYGKPMYVFSFASAEGPQKAAWITDALTVQMKRYPLLEGWVWFNQNKERDWRIWSDDASLTAFKNAIAQ